MIFSIFKFIVDDIIKLNKKNVKTEPKPPVSISSSPAGLWNQSAVSIMFDWRDSQGILSFSFLLMIGDLFYSHCKTKPSIMFCLVSACGPTLEIINLPVVWTTVYTVHTNNTIHCNLQCRCDSNFPVYCG